MILKKMLYKTVKQVLCCVGIVLVIFFISTKTEASSRSSLTNQDITEEMIIKHRKIDLNGNFFDVYINIDTEIITIRGEIEVNDKVDWNEVEKIKQYFNMRNPANYEFVYKFKFIYNT